MPLFRRKTDKSKTPPDVKLKHSSSLKRTPSNKSRDLSNGTVSQGQVLPADHLSKDENFESIHRKSSQLCKSLHEILSDKNSLVYFIQFLEARKAGQLIRFCLDAESFQASTWSRIRSHSLNVAKTRRKTSNESEKTSEIMCEPQDGDANIHKSSPTSVEKTDEEKLTNSKDETCVQNNLSVIQNSAKEMRCSQNPFYLGELSQNVNRSTSDMQNISKSNSFSDSSNTSDLKHSGSPDSDVFVESPDKESTAAFQTMKGINKDWTEKLKKSIENDAVRIFTKYLSKDATDPIGVDDVLRSQCISKICCEDGEVDPECFVDCQNFSISKMESEHFPSYNGSEFHLKYQIDLLTSGPFFLSDFLYYDAAFFYFMEFMEQEGGSNILQFWIAVENFEKHLRSHESGYDGMQAQCDAMVLYDKYFSLQATHPLGFDDKARFDVECNICREEGPLPDCFAKPREMVLKTIEKVYFSEFRQSEIFYKYLSELVGTLHSFREIPKQRRRTDSDCSMDGSTHSGESVRSTRNTLLATGTSHLGRAIHKFDSDMNIDPGLLNPDLLWKRDNPKMEIGKVDKFGQYMSEFDTHPDTEKSKGKIFFKRRKDKEKEEEEMALRIAQMIINDVTSVTQTISAMKSGTSDVTETSQTVGAITQESFSDKAES